MVAILIVVFIVACCTVFYEKSTFLNIDSTFLEVSWTVTPICILISIASPRIYLLSLQECFHSVPFATVKLVSRQWRWQREQENCLFDHVLDEDKINEFSSFYSPVFISRGKSIRFLLTRTDVLHSLGVPRIGIKLDSNPGRLNCVVIDFLSVALLTGSCYELCGRGHRAIPIFLKVG